MSRTRAPAGPAMLWPTPSAGYGARARESSQANHRVSAPERRAGALSAVASASEVWRPGSGRRRCELDSSAHGPSTELSRGPETRTRLAGRCRCRCASVKLALGLTTRRSPARSEKYDDRVSPTNGVFGTFSDPESVSARVGRAEYTRWPSAKADQAAACPIAANQRTPVAWYAIA